MSAKRYEYKVLESDNVAELEQQLNSAGTEGWGAVGYGVLPTGTRSVMLQRKQYDKERHGRHHHDRREAAPEYRMDTGDQG